MNDQTLLTFTIGGHCHLKDLREFTSQTGFPNDELNAVIQFLVSDGWTVAVMAKANKILHHEACSCQRSGCLWPQHCVLAS